MKTESYKIKTKFLNIVRQIKEKEGQTIIWHIERALNNYFKAKKLSPWDSLPKSTQVKLKNKAKVLIK